MSSLLVTGATGLLGTRLIAVAAAAGHKVYALARYAPPEQHPNVRPVVADLAQPLDFSALPPSIDAVFHLAQSRRFREFPDGAGDMFEVNVARTAELLRYAQSAGASHFALASTGSVYGPSTEPLHEDSQLAAEPGFYAASKLAAELLARPYAPLMVVAILRYFVMYGPGQEQSMLIPRLVDSVREARAIRVGPDGGLRINPVHVTDACDATLATLSLKQSATINIAGPQSVTVREVGEIIGEQLGIEPRFDVADGPPASLIADTSLMRRDLVVPSVAVQAGIGRLL